MQGELCRDYELFSFLLKAIEWLKSVIARMTRDNLFPANVPKTIRDSFM